MKLATFLIAIAAAATLNPALIAQTNDPTHAYRDEVSKFIIRYPADMDVALQPFFPIKPGKDPNKKSYNSCISTPFTATRQVGERLDILIENRIDDVCIDNMDVTPRVLAIFTQTLFTQGISTLGQNPVVSPDLVSGFVEGHDAISLSGHVSFSNKPGMTLYLSQTCIRVQKDMVSLQFISSTEDGLKMLQQSSIQFEGGSPLPVFPLASSKIVELTDKGELRENNSPSSKPSAPPQ